MKPLANSLHGGCVRGLPWSIALKRPVDGFTEKTSIPATKIPIGELCDMISSFKYGCHRQQHRHICDALKAL